LRRESRLGWRLGRVRKPPLELFPGAIHHGDCDVVTKAAPKPSYNNNNNNSSTRQYLSKAKDTMAQPSVPSSSINKTSTSAFTSSATNPTNSTNAFQVGNEATASAVETAKQGDVEQTEHRSAGKDTLDEVSETDEGYEEKMEGEYAKREGGA